MAKTAFLVSFCPMTRVVIDVADPVNLTAKEQDLLVSVARSQIMNWAEEKLNGDNIDEVRLDDECPYGTLAIDYEMAKAKAALNSLPKPKDMTDDELKKQMGDESRRYIMAFRGYDSLRSAMNNLSDTLYLQRNKYHGWSDIQMRHADLELELMNRRLEAMRKKRGY